MSPNIIIPDYSGVLSDPYLLQHPIVLGCEPHKSVLNYMQSCVCSPNASCKSFFFILVTSQWVEAEV